MSEPNYAYNEDKMLEGIRVWNEERRAILSEVLMSARALAEKPLRQPLRQPLNLYMIPTSSPAPAAPSLVLRLSEARRIIRAVAEAFGLKELDLMARSNEFHICRPRQLAMFLIREQLGLTLPAIGRIFGKHHTTVLHGCRMARVLMEQHQEYASLATSVMEMARAGGRRPQESVDCVAERKSA